MNILAISMFLAAFTFPLNFTTNGIPALVKENNNLFAKFEVDQYCDVAVSIINPADSSVVRHLAGGVLGSNAPAPLQKSSLFQKIQWDGLNNMGAPVANPENMKVRVRAGMKPKLTHLVGDNPYTFSRRIEGVATMNNELYVYGATGSLFFSAGASTGQAVFTIRVYDSTGQFKRTIFPYAPNMSIDSVKHHGIFQLQDGSYAPKIPQVYVPIISRSLVTDNECKMVAGSNPGELFLFSFHAGSFQTISTNGSIKDSLPKKLSPAPNYYPFGSLFCSASHNPRFKYFSGMFEGTTVGSAISVVFDSFNTFVKKPVVNPDGRVWKLDVETGNVTPWLVDNSFPRLAADRDSTIGTSIVFSTFHGTAVDDSGHVFVADRLHGRIGVYDTNAVFLGSIPLKWPDEIVVDKKSGTIYATSRERNNRTSDVARISLYKFSGWRGVTAPTCTVAIYNTINRYRDRTHLSLTSVNGRTIVWTGYLTYGVKAYSDMGTSFAAYREFPMGETGYDHIEVDKSNETVYFTNSYCGLYKITDWNNPVIVRCSTSFKKPLFVADAAISPDGFLYGREGDRSTNQWYGPIRRFTRDYYHAPAPFINTGKDTLIRQIVTRADAGWGDKGMSVSRFGKLAIISPDHASGNRMRLHASQYDTLGGQDTSMSVKIVNPLGYLAGGIKHDMQGNVYIGMRAKAADHTWPIAYESDKVYTGATGAIVKYPAFQTGFGIDTTLGNYGPFTSTPGALKVYSTDYGPFGSAQCVCRSPRFDVDPYNRIFVPNALQQKITVIDNEGNVITQFGKYGNYSSRGSLPGEGTVINTPEFPFAWPIGVAASENNIFVTDLINTRVAKIRMDYDLDNTPWVPGITATESNMVKKINTNSISLSSSPNPFNPVSRISVYVSGRSAIKLSVYDALGKLTATIFEGEVDAGVTTFNWDSGRNGKAAAGIYFYRLHINGKTLTSKTVLAK